MALAVAQTWNAESATTVTSLQSGASPSPVTTGNTLVVTVKNTRTGGVTTSSVTDTASNTYSKAVGAVQGTADSEIWYCSNVTGQSGLRVTVNISGAGYPNFDISEVSGAANAAPEVTHSNNGTSGSPNTGAFTTLTANSIIFGCLALVDGPNSITPPSGYTEIANEPTVGVTYTDGDACYKIVSTIQTGITLTWTVGTSGWAATVAAFKAGTTASMTASPGTVPSNHSTNITFTLAGTGTSWTGGTTFTVSGVSGWAKVSQNVTSGTAATLVVTCPGAASPPAGATGTLVVSDGTLSANVAVATPTLAVSPTSGSSQNTTSVTFTGANTFWATDHPAFTTSVSGSSISGTSWASDSSATANFVAGATGGASTITDPSTGATCTFTINTPTPPAIPIITIAVGATDVITVTAKVTAGANPVGLYYLYAGSTPGGESGTAVATIDNTGVFPKSFAAQPTATAGAAGMKFYTVKAGDNLGTPTLSGASNEVSSRLTDYVSTGVTYWHLSAAGYGVTAAGLTNIGFKVEDKIGATLIAHTTVGAYESPGQPGTYLYGFRADLGWPTYAVLADAPPGGAPFFEVVEAPSANVTWLNNNPAAAAVQASFYAAATVVTVQATPAPTATAFAGQGGLVGHPSSFDG